MLSDIINPSKYMEYLCPQRHVLSWRLLLQYSWENNCRCQKILPWTKGIQWESSKEHKNTTRWLFSFYLLLWNFWGVFNLYKFVYNFQACLTYCIELGILKNKWQKYCIHNWIVFIFKSFVFIVIVDIFCVINI